MHNLLILSRHFREFQDLIQAANLPELSILATQDPADAIQRGIDSDLVFGEPSLVCHVLSSLPRLRWVQSTWAGVDPLVAPGMRRDYMLTNVRRVYGPMMIEYVFGYLLLIERHILTRWQSQASRVMGLHPAWLLRNKLLGLLGVGSIGSHLARTAYHFGMHVRGYTRRSEDCPEVEQYYHGDSLTEFASGLDYLVCVLPNTDSTRSLVDANLLAALPAHAWLINVGRGSTVDEQALADALNSHQLAGSVLDVFNEEPLPPGHPLWHTPNTFITAHTAAINDPPDIAALFIENYPRFIRGNQLLGRVDFKQGY